MKHVPLVQTERGGLPEGVQALTSRSRGEAFAIKIIDGSKPALFAASVEAMLQLGWLNAAQEAALAPRRAAERRVRRSGCDVQAGLVQA